MESRIDPEAARAAREEVEAAFPDVPPRADLVVVTAGHWYDERGTSHAYRDPEGAQVESFFARRRWSAVPAAELMGWKVGSSCWSFLSPSGRAYYLPAFLRAFLEGPLDDLGFTILEATVRALTPPEARGERGGQDRRSGAQRRAMDEELTSAFHSFVQTLTSKQKNAVAGFLRVFEPAFDEPGLDNPVRDALSAYWGKFLPHSNSLG